MRVKSIIPKREKVATVKSTEVDSKGALVVADAFDFYRVIPQESDFDVSDVKSTLDSILSGTDSHNGSVLIIGNNQGSENQLRESGYSPVIITTQEDIIKTLEQMYGDKIKPAGLVFDYDDGRTNVHSFLRDIYIQQNMHIFRNLPIAVLNYNQNDTEPMIKPIRVLAVNGSPRKKGDTKRLLQEEIDRYWTGSFYESAIADLKSITECVACGGHQKNCEPDCKIDDQMNELLPAVKESDVLLVGSPVYMDMPTARTNAFLSRLTGQTKFNRREYVGKYATALSPGWCSGTKAVIGALTNAMEMMGFTIQGRSTREYIGLWPDGKTRGGVPHDFYWPK